MLRKKANVLNGYETLYITYACPSRYSKNNCSALLIKKKKCVYNCIYMYIYAYIHIYTYMYVYIHLYTYECIHKYLYIYVYTYVCIYMYVYIYIIQNTMSVVCCSVLQCVATIYVGTIVVSVACYTHVSERHLHP